MSRSFLRLLLSEYVKFHFFLLKSFRRRRAHIAMDHFIDCIVGCSPSKSGRLLIGQCFGSETATAKSFIQPFALPFTNVARHFVTAANSVYGNCELGSEPLKFIRAHTLAISNGSVSFSRLLVLHFTVPSTLLAIFIFALKLLAQKFVANFE